MFKALFKLIKKSIKVFAIFIAAILALGFAINTYHDLTDTPEEAAAREKARIERQAEKAAEEAERKYKEAHTVKRNSKAQWALDDEIKLNECKLATETFQVRNKQLKQWYKANTVDSPAYAEHNLEITNRMVAMSKRDQDKLMECYDNAYAERDITLVD